jgi:transcriptional regulator with XRE-family HTH domain
MAAKSFKALFQEAEQRGTYQIASVILDFTEELHKQMEKNGVSRVELARRLNVSPAYVTKALRGNVNFTVETMVRLANAVGGKIYVHLAPESHEVRWFDVIERAPQKPPTWEKGSFRPAAQPSTMEVKIDESSVAA